jgi:hypothetical protein
MVGFLAATVERWPLARLLPYVANARTPSDEQIAQIAGSIAEFGFRVGFGDASGFFTSTFSKTGKYPESSYSFPPAQELLV